MFNREAKPSLGVKRSQTKLVEMLQDVLRLAAFAVETGRLPDQVSLGELNRLRTQLGADDIALTDEEMNRLGTYYILLQTELTPVTAVSLAATDCRAVKDCMNTEAGWHARRLWILAFFVVALIATFNLVQYFYEFYPQFDATGWANWAKFNSEEFIAMTLFYRLTFYATPFLYGALGACVHIMRVTERHLRMRTFDPRRIPQHRNRVVLGTLSGGIIVLFLTIGEGTTSSVQLTAAAAGFLAGYSVDFLFAILDRILGVIVPAAGNKDKEPNDLSATYTNMIAASLPKRNSAMEVANSSVRSNEKSAPSHLRSNQPVTPIRVEESVR